MNAGSPYPHAVETVARAHRATVGWARGVLDEAGLGSLDLRAGGAGRAGAGIDVVPHAVGPWPKIVENGSAVPLLSTGSAEDLSAVPETWRRLARALSAAIERSFPAADASARARFHPLPPLDRLPEPLRAWYRSHAAHEGAESWVVPGSGRDCGRLPSLGWRGSLQIRLTYLMIARPAEDEDEALTRCLSALGALSLALSLKRTLRVRLPAWPCEPALWGFTEALAQANEGELAAELREAMAQAAGEADHSLTIVPVPAPTGEALADLMKALGRPLQPALNIAVHVSLGAGAEFGPGSTATVTVKPSPDRRGSPP